MKLDVKFSESNSQFNAQMTDNKQTFSSDFEGVLKIQGEDGKSAYEIAVENGFVGTEIEWLESLQGEDGKDGKDGADGKDGYTPIKGVDYFDGINGKDGVDGKAGRDGTNGIDGKDGYTPIKGVDYFDGVNGKDGTNGVDGKDGNDGADGHTPIKGTDYWTEQDKSEIVDDVLAELPELPSGGGGNAIIDVLELPKEFYRKPVNGTFYHSGVALPWVCNIVETLPSEGVPATYDFENFTLYYDATSRSSWGYVDEAIGSQLEIPADWYPSEAVAELLGVPWGGIVYDMSDIPSDSLALFIEEIDVPANESINTNSFYRVPKGTFYDNRIRSPWKCIFVEELPSVGETCVTDMDSGDATFYYETTTNSVSGYVNKTLGATLGINVGWHLAEELMGRDLEIVFNSDDILPDSVALLIEYELYQYSVHWDKIGNDSVGWFGEGESAEKFNYGGNIANGIYSHAEGMNTQANGNYSHAEGYNTQANGDASHAEGSITQANGSCSHAEGSSTQANGSGSHAEGSSTQANGNYSHAEGYNTQANGENQHVQGKYNIEDTANRYAHIVGNGKNDDKRSNAHTLDWNGNAWYKGDVKVGGTGQDDPRAKTLATTEYVDNAIANAGGGSAPSDIVGTWVLNYDLNLTDRIEVDVDFTSYDADGVKREFNRLTIGVIMGNLGTVMDYSVCYYDSDGNTYTVCDTLDVVWYNDMSRIITITTPPNNEEFIAFLKENAIKEDPYIKKIKVILNGSEMVTDIINKMVGAGYELGQFAIFEFSNAGSGTYGFTINHYGGNMYNIGGIAFGTFYSMANQVMDWSTVNMWSFFSMFQPPIPYCDESNNGQVLKVVNGVPTWA